MLKYRMITPENNTGIDYPRFLGTKEEISELLDWCSSSGVEFYIYKDLPSSEKAVEIYQAGNLRRELSALVYTTGHTYEVAVDMVFEAYFTCVVVILDSKQDEMMFKLAWHGSERAMFEENNMSGFHPHAGYIANQISIHAPSQAGKSAAKLFHTLNGIALNVIPSVPTTTGAFDWKDQNQKFNMKRKK